MNFMSSSSQTIPHLCMIHYGEISLRGRNRSYFEEQILRNLERVLKTYPLRTIRKPRGRFILEFEENPPWDEIVPVLKRVFGIANFAPSFHSPLSLGELKNGLTKALEGKKFSTFGIRARRSNKRFGKDSAHIERELGTHVEGLCEARVDLESPECWIRIEVGEDGIYYYFDKFEGAGGLPTPLTGRVLSLISGGIDSPVAAYRMMRRGCEVLFLHFHSTPFTSPASIHKVRQIVKHLTQYQMDSRLYLVPFGELQQKIVALGPSEDRVLLYRRAMLRIAETIANKEKALSLVTGENLGQVASQTLTNLTLVEASTTLPVFRPLIGMDKRHIVDEAREIETFPLSILPDQDCCSFMLPDSPSTKGKRELLETAENELSLQNLMENSIAQAEVETYSIDSSLSS